MVSVASAGDSLDPLPERYILHFLVSKLLMESEKRSKSGNFLANLIKFRVEIGPFQFVTHCYIGHSPVN